mmetsp:Transcript_11465/g.24851  ORF Transcript_11465/g.24851 Transcript_11465/m.24851 type:complete len:406 (-) Transcript_11465:2406-3623(-)
MKNGTMKVSVLYIGQGSVLAQNVSDGIEPDVNVDCSKEYESLHDEEMLGLEAKCKARFDDVAFLEFLNNSLATTTLGLVELRLSGCLKALVEDLQHALIERVDFVENQEYLDLLLLKLQLLCVVSNDADCAEEIGNCMGHRLLVRMMKSFDWPWVEDSVQELISEIMSNTLSTLGALTTSSQIGAEDYRPRPFYVEADTDRIFLRQVRETSNESGTVDRANARVGYKLWGGSLVLTNFLCSDDNCHRLVDKRVLEIGAGLGLCGLAVAKGGFGANSVTLTDFHPRIVENLDYNIGLNCVMDTCKSQILDWECIPKEGLTYDCIIGSDIICQELDCHLVANVLHTMLAIDGEAIFTLGSSESRFGVAGFEKIMQAAGFSVEQVFDVQVPDICLPPEDGSSKGNEIE